MPNDPVMLLSFINTQLRDYYNSLSDLCKTLNVSEKDIISKLATIDYEYNEDLNKFV